MALTKPGTYVLYKEFGTNQRSHPGLVYPDDFAPLNIQQTRPNGYVTLLLLLNEPYEFRWATSTQLSPLGPFINNDSSSDSNELRQAHDRASFFQSAGLGLEYWMNELEDQLEPISPRGPTSALEELVEDDDEIDEQLAEALRISREHLKLPTPPNPRSGRHLILDDDSDDNRNGHHTRPPKLRFPSISKRSYDPDHHEGRRSSSPIGLHQSEPPRKYAKTDHPLAERRNAEPATKQKRRIPATLDELLGQSSLHQHSAAPVSDIIDGDISQSKDFVRVAIGPDKEIRNLQKKDVWNRPYFRDSRTGINHFSLDEDNNWELRHPQLVHVDLEDFRFIAEYLEDGEFGLRIPEGHDENKESIAQCMSAWATAEKLGMDDLLEHIAEKVKFLEWDNEDVLTLAIIIYRTSGPSLHAHDTMRDWISSSLAHHFWTYTKDEAVAPYFRKRLRKLPELERDVFVKRAKSLTTGTEPDEDEESDEEELGNDSQ